MSDEELIASLLTEPKAVLSTHLADGGIHTVPVYFLVRDGRILVSTYAAAQKVRNVRRDPRASVLVERGHGYTDLQGALLHGTATVLDLPTDEVAGVAIAVYGRFNGTPASPEHAAHLRRQAAKRVIVAFGWDRAVVWDHTDPERRWR